MLHAKARRLPWPNAPLLSSLLLGGDGRVVGLFMGDDVKIERKAHTGTRAEKMEANHGG